MNDFCGSVKTTNLTLQPCSSTHHRPPRTNFYFFHFEFAFASSQTKATHRLKNDFWLSAWMEWNRFDEERKRNLRQFHWDLAMTLNAWALLSPSFLFTPKKKILKRWRINRIRDNKNVFSFRPSWNFKWKNIIFCPNRKLHIINNDTVSSFNEWLLRLLNEKRASPSRIQIEAKLT